MPIVDLTYPAVVPNWNGSVDYELTNRLVPLQSNACKYTGVTHTLTLKSMNSTYIDFPGHIQETDDGFDSANYPLEKLFRQEATVLHMDRESESGAVTADDLRNAAGGNIKANVLVINALGKRPSKEIACRSVWLTMDAVDWIISTGCHILISDIYESRNLDGVFLKLFQAGVSTVCEPYNLFMLPAKALISVCVLPTPKMYQTPCRLLAEF